MAKNTSSSAFRKIDIDQYCEDNFKEDEADQGGPVGPDETEVLTLLNQYPFHHNICSFNFNYYRLIINSINYIKYCYLVHLITII